MAVDFTAGMVYYYMMVFEKYMKLAARVVIKTFIAGCASSFG